MKQFLFFFCIYTFLLATNLKAQCLRYPVELKERIQKAHLIVEGKIISSRCFQNTAPFFIYTAHKVEVYKSFKGSSVPKEIVIATVGGRIGNRIDRAEPALELQPNQTGIFTLEPFGGTGNPFGPMPIYQCYADAQGFIEYLDDESWGSDIFNQYQDSFPLGLYQLIMNHTGQPYQIIKERKKQVGHSQEIPMAPPSIASFSPLSVTAGNETVLTINGSNFGTTPGKVEFTSADQGPGFFHSSVSGDIISWNNNTIQLYVPFKAGTGPLRVTNASSEVSPNSPTSLQVQYNLTNVVQSDTNRLPDLVDNNGMKGYTFFMHTDFKLRTGAEAALRRAFESWRCATQVNFDISNNTTAIKCQDLSDGVNIVSFDDGSCSLPAGVLGVCFHGFFACSRFPNRWFSKGIDLVFVNNPSPNGWNFGPAPTSGGRYDFESVVLHETGHGHLIGHVIDNTIVMNRELPPNTDVRSLNLLSDVAAGNDILSQSTVNSFCYDPMQKIGLTECDITDPRIQFERDSTVVIEGTTSTTDCRGYKDYSLNITISAPPAGDIPVAIKIKGKASVPGDIEVFPTSVVFNAGSAAPKTIILRIYDDQAVEETEIDTLTLEVPTNPFATISSFLRHIVLIQDNDQKPGVILKENFENPATFGTSWKIFSNGGPNQFIVGLTSPIEGRISAYVSNSPTTGAYAYTINDPSSSAALLVSKEIDATGLNNINVNFDYKCAGELSGGFYRDCGLLGYSFPATPNVYQDVVGSQSNPSAPTPFVNTPTATSYSSPTYPAAVNNAKFHVVWYWRNNASGGTNPPLMIDNVEVTAGAIETALSSRNHYLGPFATVYFTNPLNEKVMAKIENLTDFDYGCTQVEIDRTGNSAQVFQNPLNSGKVSDKTFIVRPTIPNPTGRFRLTLYYVEAEIAGWEAATGNSRNNLSILKSPDPISVKNPVGAVYGTNTTIRNAYGGLAITAEFTGGFSGFALAVPTPDGPLPLNLISFEGFQKKGHSVLNWKVANETEHTKYTVEKSVDAQSFIPIKEPQEIQKLPSSKTNLNHYCLIDPEPLSQKTFYRLKIDALQKTSEYSHWVELNPEYNAPTDILKVYPNPSKGIIHLQFPLNKDVDLIRVISLEGKVLLELNDNPSSTIQQPYEIDLSNLPKGAYFLEYEINKQRSTVLFILN